MSARSRPSSPTRSQSPEKQYKVHSHYGGPAFTFSGRRDDPTMKSLAQNPGPGQYSTTKKDLVMSRSPAFHIGLKSSKNNNSVSTPSSVGPGSYSFNTSTLKISKPIPTSPTNKSPSRSPRPENPGPGSYNTAWSSFRAVQTQQQYQQRSSSSASSSRPSSAPPSRRPTSATPHSPGNNQKQSPGPGQYTPYKSKFDEIASFRPTSASTARPSSSMSFRSMTSRTSTPGPGSYNIAKSSFLHTPKYTFGQKYKVRNEVEFNPGPGQYNVQDHGKILAKKSTK